ncbi:unnamed protein product, partial [marine sediment metagenome]
ERRWQEEKNNWMQNLRRKEEELTKLKMQSGIHEDEINRGWERKLGLIESEKRRSEDEIKFFKTELETKEKGIMSVKSQITLLAAEIKQEKDKIDKYRQLVDKLRNENESLIKKLDTREKEYYVLKTQTGLLSAKTKSEQEKLSKEIESLKEYINQLKTQKEVSIKSKNDEINSMQQTFTIKENELRTLMDKRDEEIKNLKTIFEEKIHSKEVELDNASNREKELQVSLNDARLKQKEYETQINTLT